MKPQETQLALLFWLRKFGFAVAGTLAVVSFAWILLHLVLFAWKTPFYADSPASIFPAVLFGLVVFVPSAVLAALLRRRS